MAQTRIGVVVGTTRPTRYADTPAAWIMDRAAGRTDMTFELIDLRDYPLPFFEEAVSPLYGPATNPVAIRWDRKMADFDGYIFVTAEYNHGISGALKNALDHAYSAYNRKPAAFVAYGGVGGARAVQQLRLVCAELQMAPLRHAVHITLEPYLATLKGQASLADYPQLGAAADRMLEDLSWWSNALRTARCAG